MRFLNNSPAIPRSRCSLRVFSRCALISSEPEGSLYSSAVSMREDGTHTRSLVEAYSALSSLSFLSFSPVLIMDSISSSNSCILSSAESGEVYIAGASSALVISLRINGSSERWVRKSMILAYSPSPRFRQRRRTSSLTLSRPRFRARCNAAQ